jgi:hypothetical protein
MIMASVDLKGAGEALEQRTQQKELENKQKEQENHEQMQALKTFKAVLDEAKGL